MDLSEIASLPIPWHLAPYRPILFPLLLAILCLGLVFHERQRRKQVETRQTWFPPRPAAGAQLASAAAGVVLPPADAALREERWADALRLLRAEELDQGDAWTPFHMGLAFEHLDGWPEAEACYRATLEAAPGHRDATYNLARLLGESGRVPEAITTYKQLLAFAPEDVGALFNLGHLYFGLRLHAQARQMWHEAKDVDSNAADVRANLLMLTRLAQATTPVPRPN
jgi:tetratricopeptide (TPR) repeat protein